jgi:hypothetical protein
MRTVAFAAQTKLMLAHAMRGDFAQVLIASRVAERSSVECAGDVRTAGLFVRAQATLLGLQCEAHARASQINEAEDKLAQLQPLLLQAADDRVVRGYFVSAAGALSSAYSAVGKLAEAEVRLRRASPLAETIPEMHSVARAWRQLLVAIARPSAPLATEAMAELERIAKQHVNVEVLAAEWAVALKIAATAPGAIGSAAALAAASKLSELSRRMPVNAQIQSEWLCVLLELALGARVRGDTDTMEMIWREINALDANVVSNSAELHSQLSELRGVLLAGSVPQA